MHISAFNIAVACAVTLTVPERAATAQPLKDSAYFCTTEFQAGLVYDPSIKGWRSGLFKPQRKFILQVKYSGQKEDKAPVVAGDPAMTFYHYYLTLTEPGTDFRDPCFDFRS